MAEETAGQGAGTAEGKGEDAGKREEGAAGAEGSRAGDAGAREGEGANGTAPAVDFDSLPEAARDLIRSLSDEAGRNRKKAAERERELADLRRSTQTESERALTDAEERGRKAAEAEYGRRLLETRVRAEAAAKYRDPADAVRFLDLETLGEDPTDADLRAALEGLLKAKPYLARAASGAGLQQGARTGEGERAGEGTADDWLRKAARGG